MAVELAEYVEVRKWRGWDNLVLAEGKHLKIETSPSGEDLLDYVAPAGGATVTVYVQVVPNS